MYKATRTHYGATAWRDNTPVSLPCGEMREELPAASRTNSYATDPAPPVAHIYIYIYIYMYMCVCVYEVYVYIYIYMFTRCGGRGLGPRSRGLQPRHFYILI